MERPQRSAQEPKFHFFATSWINDPCAPGYDPWTKTYHLFYQCIIKSPLGIFPQYSPELTNTQAIPRAANGGICPGDTPHLWTC